MTGPLYHRTLVLANETTAGMVRATAAREGWQAYYACGAGYKEKVQLIWVVSGEGEDATTLNYFEEHWGGFRCVAACGRDEAEVEEISQVLAADLTVLDENAVFASLLDDSTEAREVMDGLRAMVLFHYLGSLLGAEPGPLDPRVTAALERTLAHPHRQVRLSALIAANQLWNLWPELREPVIARKGLEVEHDYFVGAVIEMGRSK